MMTPDTSRRRRMTALQSAFFAAAAGAALAAAIFAASFAQPVTETPALRRALIDIPAAALALIGAPDLVWRQFSGSQP